MAVKKIMKKIATPILAFLLIFTMSGCAMLFDMDDGDNDGGNSGGNSGGKSFSFAVHYYDDVERSYSVAKGKEVQCDFIAPEGQVIKGLYSEDGVQYADYACVVEASGGSIPEHLYARYEDVDISYLDEDPFLACDEDPLNVSFYNGMTYTWQFEDSLDQQMIAACRCNPYADLKITVSFVGRGNGKQHNNAYISKLSVNGEAIGSFQQESLGDGYTNYTYSGTIKAKQLINGDFKITVSAKAKYGYKDYWVKNIQVDFDFDF